MEVVNDQPAKDQAQEQKTPDSLVGLTEPVAERVEDIANLNASLGALPTVTVEARHKEAFLDSLVTGDRYRETLSLYGGRVKVTFRSRTLAETDAIMSHLQHLAAGKIVTSDYEYSSAVRLAMLAAQVERLNEVEYPPLAEPLFYVDTGESVDPPGWLDAVSIWQSKPEALVAALGAACSEFEARYWAMVKASGDINFWQPGESTGQ